MFSSLTSYIYSNIYAVIVQVLLILSRFTFFDSYKLKHKFDQFRIHYADIILKFDIRYIILLIDFWFKSIICLLFTISCKLCLRKYKIIVNTALSLAYSIFITVSTAWFMIVLAQNAVSRDRIRQKSVFFPSIAFSWMLKVGI